MGKYKLYFNARCDAEADKPGEHQSESLVDALVIAYVNECNGRRVDGYQHALDVPVHPGCNSKWDLVAKASRMSLTLRLPI